MTLDLDRPYRLNPNVALRPEPFGALAYHFGNRKLSFLKAPELVDFVRDLGSYPTLGAALNAGEWSARRRAGFVDAVESLVAADMIVEEP